MARMRTLKPEFFRDKKIAQLGPEAALVYQALWLMADDGGAAPADPERVWGEMFVFWPSVNITTVQVALTALSVSGRIKLYRSGDETYALIVRFPSHQKPNHPSKFRHPRTEEWVTSNTTGASSEPSGSHPPPVGSRQETGDQCFSAPNSAEETRGSPNGGWTRQAVDSARAVALQYQPGRITRILKPFVERDGPDIALAHWRAFLKAGRHFDEQGRFLDSPGPMTLLSPERFRDSYDQWQPSTRHAA